MVLAKGDMLGAMKYTVTLQVNALIEIEVEGDTLRDALKLGEKASSDECFLSDGINNVLHEEETVVGVRES